MRYGVGLVVAGVSCIGALAAARAAVPTSQIAFVREDRLFVMSDDGSAQHEIGLDPSAAWSHNGRWVVFPVMHLDPVRGYTIAVYVARRDGAGVRRMVGRSRADPCFEATWSADDSRIAYTVGCDVDYTDLFFAGRTGHAMRLVRGGYAKTSYWAVAPRWSPDGRAILTAAAAKDRSWRLVLLDPSSGARLPIRGSRLDLGPTPLQLAWSHDGERIFFIDDAGGARVLYRINRDGTARTRISPARLRVASFDLSPDGRTIAFTGGDGSRRDIYVMRSSGAARLRRITSGVADLRPKWSPGGTRIAFERTSRRSDSGHGFISQIWVMNADGSDPHNVSLSSTDDVQARWVPASG